MAHFIAQYHSVIPFSIEEIAVARAWFKINSLSAADNEGCAVASATALMESAPPVGKLPVS